MVQKIPPLPASTAIATETHKKELNNQALTTRGDTPAPIAKAVAPGIDLAQLAKMQPLATHLAQFLTLLQKHPLASNPNVLATWLNRLFPTQPAAVMQLLSQLLGAVKGQPSPLAQLWLQLKAQQGLGDASLNQGFKDILQSMQLVSSDTSDQQVWLFQLPWFIDSQLRGVQLKIQRPKKSAKKNKKWEILLKLPIGEREMLAHGVISETQVDLKLYCSDEHDLARVQAHQGLLAAQLTKAGVQNRCQSFLGHVPDDLIDYDRTEHSVDIVV